MHKNNSEENDNKIFKVLKHQKDTLEYINHQDKANLDIVEKNIKDSEQLLKSLGKEIKVDNANTINNKEKQKVIKIRTWEEIVKEAEENVDDTISIQDLLTENEINLVLKKLNLLREDFDSIHRLDKIDWAICGAAGVLAALVDIFLVKMPRHKGMLGSKGSEGGPLSNFIRDKINNSLSEKEIRKLENENWVPYDPRDSRNLDIKVEGLNSRTHRLSSFGHDPILGFLFGVKDIFKETFTSVDKFGKVITQKVPIKDKSISGMNIFDAIGRVYGHLKSDIATPGSLPAPLMVLTQFMNFGNIGGHSISEITRIMHTKGYNFSHFLSMSISTMIIEIIVRISYLAKRLYEGYDFLDSIPIDIPSKKPKLQTMLFTSHLIATAANAGKVAITRNPLAINYTQWLAFVRYLIPQLKWILYEKEEKKHNFVMGKINEEWDNIDDKLTKTWEYTMNDYITLC